MFRAHKISRRLTAVLLLILAAVGHAVETQPKFSIIPLTPTTVLLSDANRTQQVSYQVTNQTELTRTLTVVPMSGVSQTTTSGSCTNPFTLNPQQSCILVLDITSTIHEGPQICKTYSSNINFPDPFLCSQPAEADRLNVFNGYSIGGSVSGLIASTLILQNSNGETLTISRNGPFTFPSALPSGSLYSVTVQTQPAGQTCSISNGSGRVLTTNIDNIVLTCKPVTYTVGGSVNNLTTDGLIIQNNGGNNLAIAAGASSFQFSMPAIQGQNYNVTILTQPPGLTCNITNGSGTNIRSNITNINIDCTAIPYTISGNIANLGSNSGLELQNNGGDTLLIAPNSNAFQFNTPLTVGQSYNVTVSQQPTGISCTVNYGSGSNIRYDITDVLVNCGNTTFAIGGSISGLTTNGLILQNNGSDDLTIDGGIGSFQFPTGVVAGSLYNVTIKQQPDNLICSVTNNSGLVTNADINNLSVICSPTSFTVGGTISGLSTSGLVLQNNETDSLVPAVRSTSFVFASSIARGASYRVTVAQQPDGLFCSVINGSGQNLSANVSNVAINCQRSSAYITEGINGVLRCSINLDGSFGACTDTGYPAATQANGIVFNHDKTQVYITSSNSVKHCTVNVDGAFQYCVDESNTGVSLNNVQAITLNRTGSNALIVNTGENQVLNCPINTSGSLNPCTSLDSLFNNPRDVVINNTTTHAYVTNFSFNEIIDCPINPDYTLGNCVIAGAGALSGPIGITLNNTNSIAYVSNSGANNIVHCAITGSDYSFNTCVDAGGNAGISFSAPRSITLNRLGTKAYIANGDGAIIKCVVDSDGTLSNCMLTTGSGTAITNPQFIAIR